jgi:hypothetical protein
MSFELTAPPSHERGTKQKRARRGRARLLPSLQVRLVYFAASPSARITSTYALGMFAVGVAVRITLWSDFRTQIFAPAPAAQRHHPAGESASGTFASSSPTTRTSTGTVVALPGPNASIDTVLDQSG